MHDIVINNCQDDVSIESRIAAYHNEAVRSARNAVAAAIHAGALMCQYKEAYGAEALVELAMRHEISDKTATRYMSLASACLGDKLLEESVTEELPSETLEAVDGKSLTRLYKDFGIIKERAGGARAGAGRKSAMAMTLPSLREREAMCLLELEGLVRALGEFFASPRWQRVNASTEDVAERLKFLRSCLSDFVRMLTM